MYQKECPMLSVPPFSEIVVASRAANEGIPVAAIARIVRQPFGDVIGWLREAHDRGEIGEMPRSDWPPQTKWAERAPAVPRSANHEDVEFQCRKAFRLTELEAAFMMVLLRCECADKEKLHNAIEAQRRAHRTLSADNELTDLRMVDVMICKLRAKLDAHGFPKKTTILTSWGQGYYLEAHTKQKLYELIGGPYAVGHEDEPGKPVGTGRAATLNDIT
jgi:hypothetical protein